GAPESSGAPGQGSPPAGAAPPHAYGAVPAGQRRGGVVAMAGLITFVVITGMSGAGKSYAIKCFEDMGFFCVDNLPTTLIPTFADLVARSTQVVDRVALGVDVREGEYLTHLLDTLAELRKRGHSAEVLFLEASEEALVRRYRETRRRHPLSPDGN